MKLTSLPLNPYAVGGALSDLQSSGFFGREEIFQFVSEALRSKKRFPILLYGQRRIGKSSILQQLPRFLPPDHYCVYYDLQGKGSMDLNQVLYGLGRAVTERLGLSKPTREQTTEEMFASEFLRPILARLDGDARRLVLLFDEFDVVDEKTATNQIAASRFIPYLNELFNLEPGIGYIMVVGRKTEELSPELNAALLKDAVQKLIGLLTAEQSGRLVQEPAQGYMHFSIGAVNRIFELAAGHPYCTQVVCHAIWNLRFRDAVGPNQVDLDQVNAALPLALDLGTLGLNWMFDGLTDPMHRLFLSAMATVTDPTAENRASLEQVSHELRGRRIVPDRLNFNLAPSDLERWDIIKRFDGMFAFAVPLIGLWIRQQRPLERLERDVRFANPRAYNYYELALGSHQRGDLNQAIYEYNVALAENSAFLEAQQGLATALARRRKEGDINKAIEAFERVLELEPQSVKNDLLELLVESIDLQKTGAERIPQFVSHARFLKRLQRIEELDTDKLFLSRAKRMVSDRAYALLKEGGAISLREASWLLDIVDDTVVAMRTRQMLRRRWFVQIAFGVAAGAALVMGSPYIASRLGVMPTFRLLCAVLVGAFFAGAIIVEACALRSALIVVGISTTLVYLALGTWGLEAIAWWRHLLTLLLAFIVTFFLGFFSLGLAGVPPARTGAIGYATGYWAMETLLRGFQRWFRKSGSETKTAGGAQNSDSDVPRGKSKRET
jgi:tetratricopeptide (TPR) repeat protein